MTTTRTLTIATPTDREIVMARVFMAPRQLVWESMTRPGLLRRWLFGPPGWSMTDCDNDLQPGSAFRWVWRGPDGQEMVMTGVHREIVPPQRIVRTESFDGGCDAKVGEQLATLVLTEHNGDGGPDEQTALTLTLLYSSKESRDAAIASGMEHGTAAAYDSLDALLTMAPTWGSKPYAA